MGRHGEKEDLKIQETLRDRGHGETEDLKRKKTGRYSRL